MSNLQCIAEHTVDLSLINRDSKVLDLGCRAFSWSKAMLEYVDKVWCVDADNSVKSYDERLPVMNIAVSDTNDKKMQFIKFGNGTGNHLHRGTNPKPFKASEQVVKTLTLTAIVNAAFGDGMADLIKMDIEGEEILVLLSLKEPPAKQLSIEFHLHTGTPAETVHKVFDHLESLGYVRAHCDYSRKHGLPENYWDVLFILKPGFNPAAICENYGYPKKVIEI